MLARLSLNSTKLLEKGSKVKITLKLVYSEAKKHVWVVLCHHACPWPACVQVCGTETRRPNVPPKIGHSESTDTMMMVSSLA
jgi:hypothetical protein